MGSVTRSHPTDDSGSGGGGGSSDPAWYEEYSFDFTTQDPGPITHNAPLTLGSRNADGAAVVWTAEEDDSGDTDNAIGELEWVSGSGLKAKPATGTDVWNKLDTPCLNVALSDCIPNLTNRDVICVQVFTEEPIAIGSGTEGYGLELYKAAADLDSVNRWLAYRTYSSGVDRKYQVSGHPTQTANDTIIGGIVSAVPRSFEVVFYPSGGIGVCANSASTDTAAVPMASITDNRAVVQAGTSAVNGYGVFGEPAWGLDVSDLRLALSSFSVTGDGTFYNYFSSVRILRLGGHAGGAL